MWSSYSLKSLREERGRIKLNPTIVQENSKAPKKRRYGPTVWVKPSEKPSALPSNGAGAKTIRLRGSTEGWKIPENDFLPKTRLTDWRMLWTTMKTSGLLTLFGFAC